MTTRIGFHRSLHVCFGLYALLATLPRELHSQDGEGVPSTARPNIVVVMADDLDVGSLEKMVELGLMPHFAELFRAQGIRFTNAFVTNSLCCPSRATLLTGQYAHNHGVLSNLIPLGGVTRFEDHSTLATWLQDSGYRTGYVGKYLNGYGASDIDRDGDFDEADRTYVPPGWDDWQGLVDPSTYHVYNYVINDNGVLASHGANEDDYQTDVLARRASEFVAESDQMDDDRPFFLAVLPLVPHFEVFIWTRVDDYRFLWRWTIRPAPRHQGTVDELPPLSPSFNEADVGDKPAWLQAWPRFSITNYLFLVRQYRDRLESLRALDDLLGSLVEQLEQSGELERTVLVFTSDNGFLHGEHRLPQKQYAYEEAIRVPLGIRIPGATGGSTIDALVLNNDLAPTIVDLAGASPGLSMDGRSMVPLLLDPAPATWRKRFLVEHWGATNHILGVPSYAAVRTAPDNLLYVEYDDLAQNAEFYDLSVDPFQLQSLHDDPSEERRGQQDTLRWWLGMLRDCGEGSCQALEDE